MNAMPARKIESAKPAARVKRSGKNSSKVIDLFPNGKPRKKRKNKSQLSEATRQELVIEFRVKARKLGRSILRKWHARLDLEEVDSVVDLSLCEAVKRYDPTKGASFMTFLYYHLKGNLIRAVSLAANANAVPVYDQEVGSTNKGTKRAINAIDVAEALCSHDHHLPDEVLLKKELIGLSQNACLRLDPLEREVIQRIYIEGQQLMDIANELGYSRCHISRVKKKALEILQDDITFSLQLQNGVRASITTEFAESQAFNRRQEKRKVHRRRPRSRKALEAQRERAVA